MANFKPVIYAVLIIAAVALAAWLGHSCKREKQPAIVRTPPAEKQRTGIVTRSDAASEKYKAEAAKWQAKYEASERERKAAALKDKQTTEKAQHSAQNYAKTPTLANCDQALTDCQEENKAKMNSIAIQDQQLCEADSISKLDKKEIAQLGTAKDSLNNGWKNANLDLEKEQGKNWGLGFYAGYGATNTGFTPSVGVSLNYNVIRFRLKPRKKQ